MSAIRYGLTAATLKLFSVTPQLYRFLGNKVSVKKRFGVPWYYGNRARRFLSWCERHRAVKDGDRVLEIGTGWVHFESMVLRLFYDIEATLFDVWDNRQLDALKQYFVQFELLLYEAIEVEPAQKQRIKQILNIITKAESFDDLYKALGFQYKVDKNGTLDQFEDESFNLIYSYNVLEHVDRKIVPSLTKDFYRVLKPGGFSIHLIDIGDHLVYYAGNGNMSKKHYLKYSNKTWKRYFENKVQYFNRIQQPEWLKLFQETGLQLVEKQARSCNIDTIQIAEMYRHLEREDLECKALLIIHQKPG